AASSTSGCSCCCGSRSCRPSAPSCPPGCGPAGEPCHDHDADAAPPPIRHRSTGATRVSIRVVTDSSCDLPQGLVDALRIEIVPLTIRFGDEELVDREELSTDEFWQRLESTKA